MGFFDEIKEVRGLIALVLVLALVGAVFASKLDAKELVPLVAMIVGFFFATKGGNGNKPVE